MLLGKRFRIEEVAQKAGIETTVIIEWIENEWITPAEPTEREFDEEDIARIFLIRNLREDFEVNDESIPIILHLLDQIHYMHYRIQQHQQSSLNGKRE